MPPPPTEDEVREWIATYDGQGWHRTGGRADARSQRWLVAAAAAAGATVEAVPVPFPRLVLRASALTIGTVRIPGLPLHDATLPPAAGICGPLGGPDSGADIAVLAERPGGPAPGLERARREAGPRALVVLTRGGEPGLAVRNAPAPRPFGPPVLQVSSRHAERVWRAAAAGTVGLLRVDARRTTGLAHNVHARYDGPASRVVVLTPRSGWWHCAAERGGGIACWLGTLRATTGTAAGRRTSFLATTGHELGHLGLRTHLDRTGGRDGDPVWLHLGANIGARGGRLRVCAATAELAAATVQAMHTAGIRDVATAAEPVGEAAELARHRRRFVSIGGSNARFHQASDRFPDNVDSGIVTAVSRAVIMVVTALAT